MRSIKYKNMDFDQVRGCLEEALISGNQGHQERLASSLDLLRMKLNKAWEDGLKTK